MDVWNSVISSNDKRKLHLKDQTRWWAKDKALSKVFGSSGKKENSLYFIIIKALLKVANNVKSNSEVRSTAKSYRESLLKYETILTVFVLRSIFDVTTPLSEYLQTSGLDILKAYNMVKVATEN